MLSPTTRPVRLVRYILSCTLATAVITGCQDGPTLYPVKGKANLKDGTPIAFGYVILHPDTAQGNNTPEVSQGTITDGVYTILTGAREGAPPGAYKVTIEAAKDTNPNNPYFTEWLASEKYIDPAKSGLTVDVVPDPEPGRYDFQLDPPAKKSN